MTVRLAPGGDCCGDLPNVLAFCVVVPFFFHFFLRRSFNSSDISRGDCHIMRRIGTGVVCNAKHGRSKEGNNDYVGACKGLQSKNRKVDVPEDTRFEASQNSRTT